LGNASNYIIYILIFSTIVDIDHIPYILKVKKNLVHKKFGSESRSRFHELYGLTLFSLGISIFSFLDIILIKVITLSVVLHYATDFLLGKTRPFYPFSKKEVFLNICPERHRIRFEIALTVILGVIWLSILN
jgi:hypothetical protein